MQGRTRAENAYENPDISAYAMPHSVPPSLPRDPPPSRTLSLDVLYTPVAIPAAPSGSETQSQIYLQTISRQPHLSASLTPSEPPLPPAFPTQSDTHSSTRTRSPNTEHGSIRSHVAMYMATKKFAQVVMFYIK